MEVDQHVTDIACAVLDRDDAGLLPATERDVTGELHAEANTLRARLDQLADDYGDGTLDKRQYTRQRERTEAKAADVTEALAAVTSGSALDGIANAPVPSAAFLAAPVARQRAIIDAIMPARIMPAKPGRLPKGVEFDYSRVKIIPKGRT